jgi:CarboxypepD_reg-like domain
MKNLLSILLSIQVLFSYSQNTNFEGLVLESFTNNSIPYAFINISKTNEILTTITDNIGKFSFTNLNNGFYNVSIESLGYKKLDTLINLSSNCKLTFRLIIHNNKESNYKSRNNEVGAKEDIENNAVKLFLPGGYAGSAELPLDSTFEKKYQLNFVSLGCVRSPDDDFDQYNKNIFRYLDKKYGKSWRKEIRRDVIGF